MPEDSKTEQEPKEERGEEQKPKLVGKEVVIDASRRRYGMPRPEVERLIAKQMGWPTPEEQRNEAIARLSHRLQGVGVTERQAKYLISSYSLDRIKQQLDWLPYRGAYNPAAYIVAAIRRNYDPPEGLYVDQGTGNTRRQDDYREPGEHKPNLEQEPNKE